MGRFVGTIKETINLYIIVMFQIKCLTLISNTGALQAVHQSFSLFKGNNQPLGSLVWMCDDTE